MAKKQQTTKPRTKPVTAAEPSDLDDYAREVGREPATAEPIPTPELLARLRSAPSVEDALKLLAPAPKVKADPVYEVADACTAPLPQKRGVSVLVYVTAARMNRAFKAADLVAALPEKKAVPFWVRRLAKTGHFRDVSAEVVK